MKIFAAKEAKNKFGQMMDSVQYEPVTIEKNGRPVAVVLSIKTYNENEQIKLDALKRDITIAQKQVYDGKIFNYHSDLAAKIKARGREKLNKMQP